MKILSLELYKFKALSLSRIEKIVIGYVSILNLLLGGNGTGKSSLLHELVGMPAVSSDYDKGGYKVITLMHKGSSYTLRSDVETSVKHSFIKDDKELNDGHTGAVQKELLKLELGLDSYLYKLFTQQYTFTKLTSLQLRDVLMHVSGLDLDYALTVWDKLKVELRDATGALKHVQQKHRDAITSLKSLGDLESFRNESKDIKTIINKLLPHSTNTTINIEASKSKVSNLTGELNAILLNCEKYFDKLPNCNYKDYTALEEDYFRIKNTRSVNKENISKLLEELSELDRLNSIVEANSDGVSKLESELSKLECRCSIYTYTGIKFSLSSNTVLDKLKSVKNALWSHFSNSNMHSEKCNDRDYKVILSDIDSSKAEYRKLDKSRVEVERYITHATAVLDNAITCPNCKTLIADNAYSNKDKLKAYKERLPEILKSLDDIKRDVLDKKDTRDRMRLYLEHVDGFLTIIKNYSELKELWCTFDDIHLFVDSTTVLENTLTKTINEVEDHVSYLKDVEEIAKLKDTISLYKTAERSGTSGRIEFLDNEYKNLLSLEVSLDKEYKITNALMLDYNNLKSIYDKTNDLTTAIEVANSDLLNDSIHYEANALISEYHSRLGLLEGSLNSEATLLETIADLEKDIDGLITKHDACKLLVSNVCPKTGLIGEQMYTFVHDFINEMNIVISSIWATELKVNMSSNDDNGLTYKFPYTVDGVLITDLNKTSKGQKEIIDFAFNVVIMSYMGLDEYPLFLDEIGTAFDHTHRGNLMSYVKQLIENGSCSQMFMISHFLLEYGAFNNADTVVLDSNNILVPEEYNINTYIKRY